MNNKPLSNREMVLYVLKDREMTINEIAEYCQKHSLLAYQKAKDAVGSMYRTGWLIKAGEKLNTAKKNGGCPMLIIYKVNTNRNLEENRKTTNGEYKHKGLAKARMSPDYRRKLIAIHQPLSFLYAKELQLTKDMLK
jgi:hypothetical protein